MFEGTICKNCSELQIHTQLVSSVSRAARVADWKLQDEGGVIFFLYIFLVLHFHNN